MKLIYESNNTDTVQSVDESTGRKSYKIKGIYSTIGEKNKNGRIYPDKIWKDNVKNYQQQIENGSSNTLMELDHPSRTKVNMMEAVAKINKLWIEGNHVMGEATLLDNPRANQLKTLIDNGITMAVSSRGVGKINEGVVSEFKLITYDIIPDQGQSDHNAQMKGIVEGVLEGKEFMINESGEIEESAGEIIDCDSKESSDKTSLTEDFEKSDVENAILHKFNEFITNLK